MPNVGLHPFNYGNAIGQAQDILNAKTRNQLGQQKLAQNALNPSGIGEFGINPIYTKDSDGNVRIFQLNKAGGGQEFVLPPGQEPAIPGKYLDMGPYFEFVNRFNTQGNPPQGNQQIVPPQDQPSALLQPPVVSQPTTDPLVKKLPIEKTPKHLQEVEKVKALGKAEGERQDPANIEKEETKLLDNEGAIASIDELLSPREDGSLLLNAAYGRANVIIPDAMKPTGWIDAEAIRDRVVANLQLENVKKLKGTGPITENEQKILKQAASVLNNSLISAKLAERELRRVRSMFSKWAADNKKIIAGGGQLYQETTETEDTTDDPLRIR